MKSIGTPIAAATAPTTSAPENNPLSCATSRAATLIIELKTSPPSSRSRELSGFQRSQHLVQHLLRIAEQHAVVLFVEERVVDASITRSHAALHHDRSLRLP